MIAGIMIPTYCEAKNIRPLVEEILSLNLDLKILIVDDCSPDGTGLIAQELARRHPERVAVMERLTERGRGVAGLAGFKEILTWPAKYVVEMDADFSHHPRYLPAMLEAMEDCDVAVGSRFVRGGRDCGRPWLRRLITFFANIYIRRILEIKIRDGTSGYRCFRREVLESIDLDHAISLGPSVVQEILYKAHLKGFRLKEIPVVFIDRVRGRSTFNWQVFIEGFLMILVLWFLFSRIRRLPTAEEIELYTNEILRNSRTANE
ncbi:polyprenol monophosphomannose synthase [candidate division TA06 bacterium]|uniref:Polyprenol monophosphomannose synthase n=1 Tax=candidate division TA06 bacterium TaxID=2250710 RepID=A0A933IA51_UNCT6|nr:polyprenol monophosphomannose synthase [candidate division TA06 bacterium]